MSYLNENYQFLKINIEENIAVLQFNRPESLNKATPDLGNEYYEALYRIYLDKHIKVIIITGNENAYCAGGTCKLKDSYHPRVAELCAIRRNSSKVQIAMIAGYCIGAGFENAMSCDLRIAADNARFALPPKKSDWPQGARTRWHSQLSYNNRNNLFEGIFEVYDAYNMGFVNMIVPLKTLKETTMGIARVIANKPDLKSIYRAVI